MKVGFSTRRRGPTGANEDTLHVDEELGLFIVADGMGGHNAGEVASSIAVDRIATAIRQGLTTDDDPATTVHKSLLKANREVFLEAATDPWWSEMGTTVVLALLRGDHFFISHVGDSRAYLIENGTIRQLTEDHSFVAECLKQGWMTADEARTHQARHGLTMALGIEEDLEPDIAKWPWNKKGCLLLCTDGLTDVLEDSAILDIIRQTPDPSDACDTLVRTAFDKGGKDDVTVILVCS